jgi:Uma2 family endonuclease
MATVPSKPKRARATAKPWVEEDREFPYDWTLTVPASACTLAGFRDWATSDDFPRSGRISFINKELLIDMSPEEIQIHGPLKTEIGAVIYQLCRNLDLGRFFPDRTLVTNQAAGLSTEPNGTFASWDTLESGRLRLVPREKKPDQSMEVEGTPDWVLEIVSDTSVGKDTKKLREAYHRAGIPEYWLIDARSEEIDFRMLVHRPTGYEAVAARGGWQRSKVFGRSFRLERRRRRMDLWKYTLQIKPA